ncbi:MAG: hypothetical protein Q9170_000031 [Blastenia crenularia]
MDALAIPATQTSWCCRKPRFSAGGGISLMPLNIVPQNNHQIRTAPLPQKKGFEDPEFVPLKNTVNTVGLLTRVCGYRDLSTENVSIANRMLELAEEALKSKRAQVEEVDRITKQLREHGTLSEKDEYALAVITALPAGHEQDDLLKEQTKPVDDSQFLSAKEAGPPTDAFAALPFQPPPFTQSNGPLNTTNAFRGCATFICPRYRSIDDYRRKCPALVKQCTECKVNVCPDCWAKQPLCDCSYCIDNYHCPNCLPTVQSTYCTGTEKHGQGGQEGETQA